MSSFEEQFTSACNARDLPGVVLTACDASGKFFYQKAFGKKSPSEEMGVDAAFAFASCTKLMTSIAAMQCVERGQIGLDDDVSTILTELRDAEILTGFEDGTEIPILKRAEEKITLRLMLTHSAGMAHDIFTPLLKRWRESRGESGGKKGVRLLHQISTPLLFEPGSSWEYGSGIDWAGVLVSRLNDVSLQDYMRENIWDPVGAENITFHLEQNGKVRDGLVTLSARGGIPDPVHVAPAVRSEEKVVWMTERLYEDPIADEYGGGGSIGLAGDYMKMLQSLCSDDGRLLKTATIDEMFKPQLQLGALKDFPGVIAREMWSGSFASHPPDIRLDHGLGGMLIMDDETTGLKKGTLTWSGLANTLWTIDRETGICLFYASNLVPFGDPKSYQMQQLFEREMYSRYAKHLQNGV